MTISLVKSWVRNEILNYWLSRELDEKWDASALIYK